MNMEHARKMLKEALDNGLTLHGISINGKPAISFDMSHPRAGVAKEKFQSTNGLIRELLRAAMVEECLRRGLPEELPLTMDYAAAISEALEERARVVH